MKGTIFFDDKGIFIPILCKEINFNSVKGLKIAMRKAINNNYQNLINFHGRNKTITAKCYVNGKNEPIATSNIYLQ